MQIAGAAAHNEGGSSFDLDHDTDPQIKAIKQEALNQFMNEGTFLEGPSGTAGYGIPSIPVYGALLGKRRHADRAYHH